MSDFQDAFNQNNGLNNAMGNLAAINQRNQQIAQQKEQAAAIRAQTAVLEQQAKTEADRAKIEQQRLKIEQQRQRAEEAEREMRRQQEEQLKQLRNLIADSDADLERLEKKATTLDPDAFLRGMAALQANVQILNAESGALSDLSDMKALRQLKSQLAESIETHAQSGKLPVDPLHIIAARLEKLNRFFKEGQSVTDRVLKFHSDWLKPGIPAVSKADLLEAQVELAELQNKLPQEITRLASLLDSADWTSTSGAADLHPEYLVCLESLNLPTLPRAAKIRLKRYQFVHGEGPLFGEVQQHWVELGQRIESLLAQHEEHRVLLEQVDAHNQAENFRSAVRVLKSGGLIGDEREVSGTDAHKRSKNFRNALMLLESGGLIDDKSKVPKEPFSDLSYEQIIQQTESHFRYLNKIQEIHDLSDENFKRRIKQRLVSELINLESRLKSKDSELGRECLALTDAICQRMAKLKRSQRNQWLAVGAIALAVILGVIWLWQVQAETEKKRVEVGKKRFIAETAVEKVRIATEVAAEKERAEAAVAAEKKRADTGAAVEKEKAEALAKEAVFGGLVITSDPSGAMLKDAEGHIIGVTPIEVKSLTAGVIWKGSLEITGYDSAVVEAEVSSGVTKSVSTVKLSPISQTVVITSVPSGADVWENKKLVGITPYVGLPRAPGENPNFVIKLEGFEHEVVTGTVEFGKKLELNAEFKTKFSRGSKDTKKSGHMEVSNDSLQNTAGKPRDKYKMPVYAFSDKNRVVRTTAYLNKNGKNSTDTILRYNNRVRSAAADWSFYPVGTTFKIHGLPYLYVIDDYKKDLFGTASISLYTPTEEVALAWGIRTVELTIVQWGSFTRSVEFLSQHPNTDYCLGMLANVVRQRPDLANFLKK